MPGIPVGDHYPESHTASAPPQVPAPRTEMVPPASDSSPQTFLCARTSSQATETLPSDVIPPDISRPRDGGADKHQGETVQADGGQDHQPGADPRVGFPE